MKSAKRGRYRIVFSLGENFVIKLPTRGKGVICNVRETWRYYTHKEVRHHFCPIVFPFFFAVIMPKVKILGESVWEDQKHIAHIDKHFANNRILGEDVKGENLGLYRERLVLVDYGGFGKSVEKEALRT